MRDGSGTEPNKYIQKLRELPLESLTQNERAQLLSWLKASGSTEEYRLCLAGIRGLDSRALLDPITDDFESDSVANDSTEGMGLRYDSRSLSVEDETANLETGPMSTEGLLVPDPRAVTLQPLLQSLPTQRKQLEETQQLKVETHNVQQEVLSSASRFDATSQAPYSEEGDDGLGRVHTAQIKREKAKPRLLEKNEEVTKPPSLPIAVTEKISIKPATKNLAADVDEDATSPAPPDARTPTLPAHALPDARSIETRVARTEAAPAALSRERSN